MAETQASKPYKKGYGAFITWRGDDEAKKNMTELMNAFAGLGFEVCEVDEETMGLTKYEKEGEWNEQALSWFSEWIDDRLFRWEDPDLGVEQEEILFVVCYAGHGAVRENTSERHSFRTRQKHLFAVKDLESTMSFDITNLQSMARDDIDASALFVLECCYSSFNGLGDLSIAQYADDASVKKMETLAAGKGVIYIRNTFDDLTKSLARNLANDKGPRTAKLRFAESHAASRPNLNKLIADEELPKFKYRDDMARGSIVLHAMPPEASEQEQEQ